MYTFLSFRYALLTLTFLFLYIGVILAQADGLPNLNFQLGEDDYVLNEHFDSYQISNSYDLDFVELYGRSNRSVNFNWKIAAEDMFFELTEKNIRAEGHSAFDALSGKRNTHVNYITYEGQVNGVHEARITIGPNLFLGAVLMGEDAIYFEPASKYSDQYSNEIILYQASDVISEEPLVCGVESKRHETRSIIQSESERLNSSTGTTTCRKIQVAQAYESGITSRYGNPAVSTWNAAIWNVVNMFYTNQFAVDVEFEIIAETYNAAVPPPDGTPLLLPNDIGDYLTNFQTWGNGGGFGTLDFDIGNLWTTIDVSGGGNPFVIGSVMAIPGVCGNERYQIFEDFVGPTANPPVGGDLANLAVLIAHEAGHNVGMYHNNPAGPNIMEPSINVNANSFSDRSIHYFEDIAQQVTCYSSCSCIEIIQAVPSNCSADGSTFDVTVTVEHDSTMTSFNASMGSVNMNVVYGANPQSFVLSGVDASTTSITVTDGVNGACTSTVNMELPTVPVITGLTTAPPYCENNLPGVQNLQSNFSESFGSIIIEMNGDDFSNSEQTAQIIDANSNVVVNYPFGTFPNNSNTTVNSGPLLLSRGPYSVQVADWFGDGMGSTLCQATNGGPGDYEIRDGQGNVIRAAAGLQANTCSGNNAAMETTSGINPATDSNTSGNFTGAGITDTTPNDGAASFDASGLTAGRTFVSYSYDTQVGCSAIQDTIDVYSVPTLFLISTTCTNGDTQYDAVVNIGLGTWNSVLSGEAASISLSSGGVGNLSASSISVDGNITISDVPIAQSFTFTIGDGTENGGCQETINITPPTCAILPIELTAFYGIHENNRNHLFWTSATEVNNRGFEVWKRNESAAFFQQIGWIEGQVNSNETSQYSFVDEFVEGEFNYYQLKQLDLNGDFDWTTIIAIRSIEQLPSVVFKNPVPVDLVVRMQESPVDLIIYALNGEVIGEWNDPGQLARINTANWSSGLYFMQIQFENGELYQTKLIKN